MKKFFVVVIAVVAISLVSCNAKTGKVEKKELKTSAVELLDNNQAKEETGYGACRHAGCGCQAYRSAGTGGKCVCGHWDYVHN